MEVKLMNMKAWLLEITTHTHTHTQFPWIVQMFQKFLLLSLQSRSFHQQRWTTLCAPLLPLWSQFAAHLRQASLFQICGASSVEGRLQAGKPTPDGGTFAASCGFYGAMRGEMRGINVTMKRWRSALRRKSPPRESYRGFKSRDK